MTKFNLDDLVVPKPPYRAVRPVATFASTEMRTPEQPPFNSALADGLKEVIGNADPSEVVPFISEIERTELPPSAAIDDRAKLDALTEDAKRQLQEAQRKLEQPDAEPQGVPVPKDGGVLSPDAQADLERVRKMKDGYKKKDGYKEGDRYQYDENSTPAKAVEVNEEGRPTILRDDRPEPTPEPEPVPQKRKSLVNLGDRLMDADEAEELRRKIAELKTTPPPNPEVATPPAAEPTSPSGEPVEDRDRRLAEEVRREKEQERLRAEESERQEKEKIKIESDLAFDEARKEDTARTQAEVNRRQEKESSERRERKSDRMGAMDYVRGSVRWAVEKTGVKPWLSTLMPRLKSVFHRQIAEARGAQQSRMYGKLERAREKVKEFEDKAKDAGWPRSIYYKQRVHSWQKSVHACEAGVNGYDALRQRRQERHNDLQKQVFERYDRELAPLRGAKQALESKQAAALTVKKNIEKAQTEAEKKLTAFVAGKGKRIFMSAGNRKTLNGLKAELKRMEELSENADKAIARTRAPLARVQRDLEVWQGKQRAVADLMKFSGDESLKRVEYGAPELPPQRGLDVPPSEASPVVASGKSKAEWKAEPITAQEFMGLWNKFSTDFPIEQRRAQAYTQFVTERLNGAPANREQVFEITLEFLKDVYGRKTRELKKIGALVLTQPL